MGIQSRLVSRLIVVVAVCLSAATACSAVSDEPTAGLESESIEGRDELESSDGSAGIEAEGDESEAGPGSPGSQPDEEDAEDPPFVPSLTDEQLSERLSELGGRLAVGSGPEVAVIRPDGAGIDVVDGSESVVASQPTWSHDGSRLAWSSISAERQIVLVQDFDEQGQRSGDALASNVAGPPAFYLQWNDGDDRLVYIRNAAGGSVVEVGVIEPGLPANPVGEGAPFFVSWSPTPDRLLAHVNESSMDLYDLEREPDVGFTSLSPISGGFSAPAWVDDRRALVVADDNLAYFDVETGLTEPIIELPSPVRFVLSPDRTKVAYQAIGVALDTGLIALPTPRAVQEFRTALVVLDLASLEETVVTEELAVAWDWSPNSGSLAWLHAEITGQRPVGRWNFWSVDGEPATMQSEEFLISRKYGQAYLPFFAQYAQSVTGWSPDSSAFAFAGTVEGDRGVWVQLVTETVAARRVAPGDFVTWGPGESPLPDEDGSSAA